MKIANVVYENLVNHTQVEYINYIQKPVSYTDIDRTLPTLYVGWKFMKSCNDDNIIINADILSKCIIPNKLYWEFSFNEYKSMSIIGVNGFVDKAPELYFSSRFNYTNFDPTYLNIHNVNDFLSVLPNKIDRIYKYKNECLYMVIENEIIGVNLKLLNYLKFDLDIFSIELLNRCDEYIDDFDGNIYMSYYKIYNGFDLLKRFIVTIIAK